MSAERLNALLSCLLLISPVKRRRPGNGVVQCNITNTGPDTDLNYVPDFLFETIAQFINTLVKYKKLTEHDF